jgi:hypothetical protein
MTLARLITWMIGVDARAVYALRPVERLQLAAQCRRLLAAAEAETRSSGPPRARQGRSGILGQQQDGEWVP